MIDCLVPTAKHDYVLTSNYIEGIKAQPGDALYDQHLATLQKVLDATCLIPPGDIQKDIMHNQLEDYSPAGLHRSQCAYVGRKSFPRPALVPKLMFALNFRVACAVRNIQYGGFTAEVVEHTLLSLYDEALCIHPFPDGNGRTFRLALNHWRRLCNLSWIMFTPEVADAHLARLRQYEENVFRPAYNWAYDD